MTTPDRPIVVLTRIWPSARRPSVGSFIRSRVEGVAGLRVVRPRSDRLPRVLIYPLLLIDALRVRRPRGVEAHMLLPTALVGLVVARLRRVPLVIYSHGGDVRDWDRRPLPVRWLARAVARAADRVVTNSEDTARHLRRMSVDPVIAPPGIDLSRFSPRARPSERRVLYLGGRNLRKGYPVAESLADTLVGPWLRDVEPDEVPELIAAHDIVLVPSVAEPFGLVAVEAIASGRWVVASDVGGLRDIVIDGVNGTLVRDGDFEAALQRVPDYEPEVIARTVRRYDLRNWQDALARVWSDVLRDRAGSGMAERPGRPHVAMLVRNTFTHDTRVEKEARSLVGAGYRVTVVADAAPGLPDRTVTAGAAVRRVARPNAPPGIRFFLGEARLARELVRLRPDILHAHDSNALLAVALAARRLGVPFVYDAHELWLHRPRRGRSRLYEALFGAWYRVVQRITVPASSAQITVSAPIAAHLARQYGLRDVRLVPNYPEPVPVVRPLSIHGLAAGRLPPDAPVVLHLGGVMEARGIDELVEAVAACEPAHLVLLGSGPHWPAIADRADRLGVADRVHLLGPVPSDDVVAYAASATIGVQATVPIGLNNRFSLPNKLFQYMAAGIPVVASDFPQIREVVESSACGLLVDTTRHEAIAAAIRRLLADPGEARAMGARGHSAVDERFNWSSAAATLVDVYRGLVDHPSATKFSPAHPDDRSTMPDTHEVER